MLGHVRSCTGRLKALTRSVHIIIAWHQPSAWKTWAVTQSKNFACFHGTFHCKPFVGLVMGLSLVISFFSNAVSAIQILSLLQSTLATLSVPATKHQGQYLIPCERFYSKYFEGDSAQNRCTIAPTWAERARHQITTATCSSIN